MAQQVLHTSSVLCSRKMTICSGLLTYGLGRGRLTARTQEIGRFLLFVTIGIVL